MASTPQHAATPSFGVAVPPVAAAGDRRLMVLAAAAAMAAAALYGASPVLFLAMIALTALLGFAARDLPPDERRWFLWTSGVALALRIAATGVLPLLALRSGHSFAAWFGDGYYNIERSIWLRNIMLGVPIAPIDYFEAFHPIFGRTSYHYLLAYVHVLFGPSPYGAHLLSIVMYTVVVVLLYRITRRAFGPLPGMLAAIALWFGPTLFTWSISAMKESEMLCLSVVAIVATVATVRERAWMRRLGAAAAFIFAVIGLVGLRAGALEMTVGGIVLGFTLRLMTLRWSLLLVMVIALPSALWLAARPSVVARVEAQVKIAAKHHIGHVWTPGESYRVLDERFYNYDDVEEIRMLQPNGISTMTRLEMGRYLFRAGAAFLLMPELWHRLGPHIRWLVPSQVLWYAALLLAVPGILVGWRRDALVTSLLTGSVIAGASVIAPNSGNIATLIRHRDLISPFVFILAAVGATAIMNAAARRVPQWR
jgi:hypothetical protein